MRCRSGRGCRSEFWLAPSRDFRNCTRARRRVKRGDTDSSPSRRASAVRRAGRPVVPRVPRLRGLAVIDVQAPAGGFLRREFGVIVPASRPLFRVNPDHLPVRAGPQVREEVSSVLCVHCPLTFSGRTSAPARAPVTGPGAGAGAALAAEQCRLFLVRPQGALVGPVTGPAARGSPHARQVPL